MSMEGSVSRVRTAVLVGEERLLTYCAEHLLGRGWQLLAVVTESRDIEAWAGAHDIPFFADFNALINQLTNAPDHLFSIANYRIVPKRVLDWVQDSAINFHDGPLPERAGLNTPAWAILNNAQEHAITWHLMTQAVDAGAICHQSRFPLTPETTLFELNAQCFQTAAESFDSLVQQIETNTLSPQLVDAPTDYFGKHQKPIHGGFIQWQDNFEAIERVWRATSANGYRNPLITQKIKLDERCLIVSRLEKGEPATASPGTVVVIETSDADPSELVALVVSCADVDIRFSSLCELSGKPALIKPGELVEGAQLPTPGATPEQINDYHWLKLLREFTPVSLYPLTDALHPPSSASTNVDLIQSPSSQAMVCAAIALVAARANDTDKLDVTVSNDALRQQAKASNGFYASARPLRVSLQGNAEHLVNQVEAALRATFSADPLCLDLGIRLPEIAESMHNVVHPTLLIEFTDAPLEDIPNRASKTDNQQVVFSSATETTQLRGFHSEYSAARYRQFVDAAIVFLSQPQNLVSDFTLAQASDLELVSRTNARTQIPAPFVAIDKQLRQITDTQSRETALTYRGTNMSFAELDEAANRVAGYLHSHNFANGKVVGVFLHKNIEAIAIMLGILKSGSAYLPLDPSYPKDRLQFICEDSQIACLIGDTITAREYGLTGNAIEAQTVLGHPPTGASVELKRDDLAYMIYTSGSTGNPKGVKISHGNLSNFLNGVDEVIERRSGVMLSVTSLSFDISVLEIWWSLTRGLKVVVYEDSFARSTEHFTQLPDTPVKFSLYYWNTDEGQASGSSAYNLLFEGAAFADRNEFEAVWVPERHFGSFGGLYPNPSILAAALATQTKKVAIRAGSCVLPLHHPIRVAEEWAVVDNLSDGRVGISFASGWMPNDFVIAPDKFATAKETMFEQISAVHELWSGATATYPGPNGPVEISTLPRPVQPRLPTWVTSATNIDTFIRAGKEGYNLLTHLLGQDIEQLSEKIIAYRNAWTEQGHEGAGQVTLMLHTFLSTSKDHAMGVVREPIKGFLRSSLSLVKSAAWEFPTFKRMADEERADIDALFEQLNDSDLDDLLEFAFHRYFHTSGLFGSVNDCIERIDALKRVGVDEVACLIDFGVENSEVIASLDHLNELRLRSNLRASSDLKSIIETNGVTLLQCTPSQAGMIMLDDEAKAGLAQLDHLLVGGEALNDDLAQQLCGAVAGRVTNMYGPTETTVWSSYKDLQADGKVTIGQPIVNTQLLVLDSERRVCPVGIPGELYIGGDGVSLGYHNRPTLTRDKFQQINNALFYATGDLVRLLDNGDVEYLTRNDNQVKVRGYRIELGEIESVLNAHPSLESAVVNGETDRWGSTLLAAYYRTKQKVTADDLRVYLERSLPGFMIPGRFTQVAEMPLTPNGKVDRKRLRDAKTMTPKAKSGATLRPANNDMQGKVLDIWRELLETDQLDPNSNFFEVGGHSILAIRLQGKLSDALNRKIAISDIFAYPTVAGLSDFLSAKSNRTDNALESGAQRADVRKQRRVQLARRRRS